MKTANYGRPRAFAWGRSYDQYQHPATRELRLAATRAVPISVINAIEERKILFYLLLEPGNYRQKR